MTGCDTILFVLKFARQKSCMHLLYQTDVKKILNLANLLGTHLNAPSFRPVTSRLAPWIPGLFYYWSRKCTECTVSKGVIKHRVTTCSVFYFIDYLLFITYGLYRSRPCSKEAYMFVVIGVVVLMLSGLAAICHLRLMYFAYPLMQSCLSLEEKHSGPWAVENLRDEARVVQNQSARDSMPVHHFVDIARNRGWLIDSDLGLHTTVKGRRCFSRPRRFVKQN